MPYFVIKVVPLCNSYSTFAMSLVPLFYTKKLPVSVITLSPLYNEIEHEVNFLVNLQVKKFVEVVVYKIWNKS